MRTVFVNPSASFQNPRRRKRRVKHRVKRRNVQLANPAKRKRKRRKSHYRSTRPGVYVRRNAGITPFVRNPLIMDNPRRRRRKRKNPDFSLKGMGNNLLSFGGGSLIGAGVNILAIRRIENDWFRNLARIAAAVVGAAFLKGSFGGAMAGATLYPAWAELALMSNLVTSSPTATDADLNDLAADLQDIVDEIEDDDDDDEMYVP